MFVYINVNTLFRRICSLNFYLYKARPYLKNYIYTHHSVYRAYQVVKIFNSRHALLQGVFLPEPLRGGHCVGGQLLVVLDVKDAIELLSQFRHVVAQGPEKFLQTRSQTFVRFIQVPIGQRDKRGVTIRDDIKFRLSFFPFTAFSSFSSSTSSLIPSTVHPRFQRRQMPTAGGYLVHETVKDVVQLLEPRTHEQIAIFALQLEL